MEEHTSREIVLESACPNWESSIEWPQLTTHKPMVKQKLQIGNSKSILNKTVEKGGKDWSKKLDGALWAYRTTHKTPIGMTPYQFVYGKCCHLPLELEHKAYWAIKERNLDVDTARIKRRIQISELEEMRLKAYESATIYKERMKRWYDKRLQPKEFKEGDKVLLFNLKFKIFEEGKLKSKWDGPYVVHSVSPIGAVTIMDIKGDQYVVNGQ
jgi:hypothetical protein